MANTPKGRTPNSTPKSSGNGNFRRKGSGLGTGPVGNGSRKEGTHAGSSTGSTRPSSGQKAGSQKGSDLSSLVGSLAAGAVSGGSSSGNKSGGGFSKLLIIILAVVFLGGGGSFLGNLFSTDTSSDGLETEAQTTTAASSSANSGTSDSLLSILSSLGLGTTSSTGSTSTSTVSTAINTWDEENTGTLTESVVSGTRDKYTTIKGKKKDVVTIMVYMCGTDLESKYGMATKDMQEMLAADLGSNVNLIIYTGGCKKWNNNVMSNSVNQIYQVTGGKLKCLSDNEGSAAMTDPSNLSSFIQYCSKNFPANRNMLIFWDHGGGSVSGYGYDEKNASAGTMDLSGINKALKNGGVQFDIIGFDACLMATAETALVLNPYTDYLVASEESEPGYGWYYTGWLNELGSNPSMKSTEIGKKICDDFVDVSAKQCPGQSTTLSLIDVAEFAGTVPEKLNKFSTATSELISEDYKTVSNARGNVREFAASSGIDQIDFVDFLKKLGTKEATDLANAMLSAIKYNRTSSDMTNSYGVSIYFPYKSKKKVNSAVSTFNAIGLDSAYTDCIKDFATVQYSGQYAASSGGSSTASTMIDLLTGGTNSSISSSASDITSLLGGLLGGSGSSGSDITSLLTSLLGDSGRSVNLEDTSAYIADNLFNPSELNWVKSGDTYVLKVSADQWSLVNDLVLSMYYDDGEGYIDLGLDNIYSFDENGNLMIPETATWFAVNGQGCAYYYEDMVSDGSNYIIKGYIPALLDGERVELIVIFDNEHPGGYIAGARPVYVNDETDGIAKGAVPFTDNSGSDIEASTDAGEESAIKDGSEIQFLCDYYTYDGDYEDTYMLGDAITVNGELTLSQVDLDEGCANMMYRFTDIYNNYYWSEPVTN